MLYSECLGCGKQLAIAESFDELPWRNQVRMSHWKRIRCDSCDVELFVSRYRKKPMDEIWISSTRSLPLNVSLFDHQHGNSCFGNLSAGGLCKVIQNACPIASEPFVVV